jgi:hypothetical protein
MRDASKHEPRPPGHQPRGSALPYSDPAVLARLLDEWMQGDETEQRETFEILRRSLDEDQPAAYKLFP